MKTFAKSIPLHYSIFAVCVLSGCAGPRLLNRPLDSAPPVHSPSFRQGMGSLLQPGFTDGNRIDTLNNGAQAFPAMLAAIRGARQTITFESFIYYQGRIPNAFTAALEERARAGVQVKLILDAVGAAKSRPYHRRLRDAGVQLEIYRPVVGIHFHRFNHRTHRKLLVVDGHIGFLGGIGIGDEWDGHASSPEEWRDLHYRVQGPVVAQLQGAFNDNWLKTQQEPIQGPAYFPALAPQGDVRAQVFFSSPIRGRASVELMYHLAIASARRTLDIENAYFLPDRTLVEALQAAARRGVRIRILMPGEHMDQKAVQRASRKRWPALLEAGVELYEFEPTMIHSKLLIVDGEFVSIGSANFDPRSLRLNDEANMNVLHRRFAAEQTRVFERDLLRSKRVKEEERDDPAKLAEKPAQTAQTPLEPHL